jgi:hypothetical protein
MVVESGVGRFRSNRFATGHAGGSHDQGSHAIRIVRKSSIMVWSWFGHEAVRRKSGVRTLVLFARIGKLEVCQRG